MRVCRLSFSTPTGPSPPTESPAVHLAPHCISVLPTLFHVAASLLLVVEFVLAIWVVFWVLYIDMGVDLLFPWDGLSLGPPTPASSPEVLSLSFFVFILPVLLSPLDIFFLSEPVSGNIEPRKMWLPITRLSCRSGV